MDRLEAFFESRDFGIIVAVGVVAALAGIAVRRFVRERRTALRRLQRLVSSISVDALANVVIPDGMDGEIQIDYLLFMPTGLLLLDIRDAGGTVFAGENLDLWIAVEAGKRFTFENPLPRLQDRANAVTVLAPGVPIERRVVFTRDAAFPKGHPEAVTTLEGLHEQYQPVRAERSENPGVVKAQWDQIKAAATYL